MIPALILFAVTYILMLIFEKYRPYIALVSGVIYEVKNKDFFRIGIPFTLAAIIPAYIYIWLLYGV